MKLKSDENIGPSRIFTMSENWLKLGLEVVISKFQLQDTFLNLKSKLRVIDYLVVVN